MKYTIQVEKYDRDTDKSTLSPGFYLLNDNK